MKMSLQTKTLTNVTSLTASLLFTVTCWVGARESLVPNIGDLIISVLSYLLFWCFSYKIQSIRAYLAGRHGLLFGALSYFLREIPMTVFWYILLTSLFFVLPMFSLLFLSGTPTDNFYVLARQLYSLTFLICLFIYLLLTGFEFLTSAFEKQVEAHRLQRLQAQLNYKNVCGQISPDFLIASLHTLTKTIHFDLDEASDFVYNLSEVYRYTLENRDQELVHMSREATFLIAYALLLKKRYGSQLEIYNHLSSTTSPLYLVPLTLHYVINDTLLAMNPIHQPVIITIYIEATTLHIKHPATQAGHSERNNGYLNDRYSYLTERPIRDTYSAGLRHIEIPLLSSNHEIL